MARTMSDTTACHQTGAKRPAYDSHSDGEADRPVKKRHLWARSMSKRCDRRWDREIKCDNVSLSQSCLLHSQDCRKKTVGVHHWRATRDQCLSTIAPENEGQWIDRSTVEDISKRLDRIERCLHFMFPELFLNPDADEGTLTDSDDDSVTVCSENDSYPVTCQAITIVDRWLAQSPHFDKISTQPSLALAQAEVKDISSVGETASSPPLTPLPPPGGDDRGQRRRHDRNGIAEGPFWRLPRR
ncbi:hypothetical protein ANOM_007856 [Aspergillus nomiae NRRL 13137]|uniref:Uncharacterized protein n=1 Tax=Aspergillus nomiae NRRL (strain ATCC 15546 / NRRL 13137 / CBS 260.88 / M93) TaxID=1509407 RepID=A0A0L1IWH0_ASPN3|nr:uncharacterized protein ANOM_007856 [Aspergillus nomiae NRRL 13137]KNG83760.1 hypothetical protein ANOM_007856 [Aspergillus nomiae NRRL 13137]